MSKSCRRCGGDGQCGCESDWIEFVMTRLLRSLFDPRAHLSHCHCRFSSLRFKLQAYAILKLHAIVKSEAVQILRTHDHGICLATSKSASCWLMAFIPGGKRNVGFNCAICSQKDCRLQEGDNAFERRASHVRAEHRHSRCSRWSGDVTGVLTDRWISRAISSR